MPRKSDELTQQVLIAFNVFHKDGQMYALSGDILSATREC